MEEKVSRDQGVVTCCPQLMVPIAGSNHAAHHPRTLSILQDQSVESAVVKEDTANKVVPCEGECTCDVRCDVFVVYHHCHSSKWIVR